MRDYKKDLEEMSELIHNFHADVEAERRRRRMMLWAKVLVTAALIFGVLAYFIDWRF